MNQTITNSTKGPQSEPVAYLCEWDGWQQYHDESDPLPDKWDDAPKKITSLYAHPLPAVEVNEHELRIEIFTSLLGVMEEPVGERFDGRTAYRDLQDILKWVHEQRDESIAAITAG